MWFGCIYDEIQVEMLKCPYFNAYACIPTPRSLFGPKAHKITFQMTPHTTIDVLCTSRNFSKNSVRLWLKTSTAHISVWMNFKTNKSLFASIAHVITFLMTPYTTLYGSCNWRNFCKKSASFRFLITFRQPHKLRRIFLKVALASGVEYLTGHTEKIPPENASNFGLLFFKRIPLKILQNS